MSTVRPASAVYVKKKMTTRFPPPPSLQNLFRAVFTSLRTRRSEKRLRFWLAAVAWPTVVSIPRWRSRFSVLAFLSFPLCRRVTVPRVGCFVDFFFYDGKRGIPHGDATYVRTCDHHTEVQIPSLSFFLCLCTAWGCFLFLALSLFEGIKTRKT